MYLTRFSTVVLLATATIATAAPTDGQFDSYTKAYSQAGEQDRPMLVILNPGADDANRLDITEMRADTQLDGKLADYVVAEIDTTTAHGKQVHKLFKSPSLPHVVVIDNQQKKQLYRTSRTLSTEELAEVLGTYRDGAPRVAASSSTVQTVTAAKPIVTEAATTLPSISTPSSGLPVYSAPLTIDSFRSVAPPADCPSCRRNAGIRF